MLPDSYSCVSDLLKTEYTFSAILWTFHFKSGRKQARSNITSFSRNVTTGMFFQWALVSEFKFLGDHPFKCGICFWILYTF